MSLNTQAIQTTAWLRSGNTIPTELRVLLQNKYPKFLEDLDALYALTDPTTLDTNA